MAKRGFYTKGKARKGKQLSLKRKTRAHRNR